MTLRPYQQEAADAVIEWIRKTTAPCIVDAATGAGKSHIIAAIADWVYRVPQKRVLVLAPSAELVVQNHGKYLATGNNASIFSASAGQKSLYHPVVFGTPLTVKNKISRFGKEFGAVIIDEAHGMTPTVQTIIEEMRTANPNLRVVGLSATPWRMMTGYIFSQWPDGRAVPMHQTSWAYFERCVYKIDARSLIAMGYLTQPIIGQIGGEHYDTSKLELNSRGQYDAKDVDRAFVGHGRKTAAIVADIVERSRGRKGVMIFAATVQHAEEVMASLPPGMCAIVTAKTGKAERASIIRRFKAREIKYLVNVSVLTTGFDAEHVDVIAILRATESVGLLQQIIGRGLRISPDKYDVLVLDYAENIERHCPDGDIFDPKIKARKEGGEGAIIKCICGYGHYNEFTARKNDGGYLIDEEGYFTDLDGNRIQSEYGEIPGHFGRRCQHRTVGAYEVIRCDYRWTTKNCPHCAEENDIAARYCISCKGEIVDPNEKLRIEFKEMKRDPTRKQTDEVLEWKVTPSISKSGNETDRVDVVTPYRSFSFWVMRYPKHSISMAERASLNALANVPPGTITYQKDASSGFYKVFGYNRPKDEAPA